MRPPICAICGKDFREDLNEGGSISFVLSESDKQYNKKLQQSGIVSHPAGLEWFCSKHYKIAINHTHLTLDEAIDKMANKPT